MKNTVFAAAAVLLLASAPAFAAEEYFVGSALNLADHAASADTGAAQMPVFDGLAATPQQQLMVSRSGAQSGVESANSNSVAYGAP